MFNVYSGNTRLETCVSETDKDFVLEAWRGKGWANLEARPLAPTTEFRPIDEIKAEKRGEQ